MDNKYLNNKIYLMYVISNSYCKAHNISMDEFLELDKKYDIIGFISECPEHFDWMTRDEMIEEIERYVS